MFPSRSWPFAFALLCSGAVLAQAPPKSPAPASPAAAPTPPNDTAADAQPDAPAEAVPSAIPPTSPTSDPLAALDQGPPPPNTPAEREAWLRERIDRVLMHPALANAKIGVAVAEIDTGRMLYAHNAQALLNPASNVKMVTTAAALAVLGPEYRFKTQLLAKGISAGGVEGDLYLKGYGDPGLVEEDLWKMASELAARGVRKIAGDLIVDDSYFDAERIGPGFEQKDEDLPYRAPNGAVSYNYNACHIRIAPGRRPGDAARVRVDTASPYFVVDNQVKTVAGERARVSIITRGSEGHTEIRLSGTIGAQAAERSERRRVVHPDWYAGWSLRELLTRRGIRVAGQVRLGSAPESMRALVTHPSAPLGVLVRDINKSSNNFMAEQVLKALGAVTTGPPGTWSSGIAAVARFLETLGIARTDYDMRNGSGLYDSNRFTPTQLVTLLRSAYRDFRYAADFVSSLAIAGTDGTIEHRMNGPEAQRYVRAKTGTLKGVSCLSGYAGAPVHLPLVFSILMNDIGEQSTPTARRAQDAIAQLLVRYLTP